MSGEWQFCDCDYGGSDYFGEPLVPERKVMKFRKKPVIVEARLWDGTTKNAMELQGWSGARLKDGPMQYKYVLTIPTLEGEMVADVGDWIIQGVKGEYYPCKPDIFEQTYERVE